ncbi:acyl-CoA N-acyltransferase, partial [Gorgonomyces haynaldii]
MHTVQWRAPNYEDKTLLIELGESTGIFGPGESNELLGQTLEQHFTHALPTQHQVHVLEVDSEIVGWMYFGPMEPNVWNLWWIGVAPKHHGKGYGKQLLNKFERVARESGAASGIIETSSSSKLENTRSFYLAQGYTLIATERNGYGPDEDRIVFSKTLST